MFPESPLITRTSPDFPFAHQSMKQRIPGIVDGLLTQNPDFSPRIKDNLATLSAALRENAPLTLPRAPAPDYTWWSTQFEAFKNDSWLDTEWLFAEALLYRLILDATYYWASYRDPFLPVKKEEMHQALASGLLDDVLKTTSSLEERITTSLTGALWGNRFDLSLVEALEHGRAARSNTLVVDHLSQTLQLLLAAPLHTLHLVMDNAGTEQLMDYALVHTLLLTGVVKKVVLHIKMHPILVSDVTVPDVHRLLDLLIESDGKGQQLGLNLKSDLETGRLEVIPHFFWNAPLPLRAMPEDIRNSLKQDDFVILKGDFNYRKATLDAVWPPGSTLVDALGPIPCPFLALRTLKCNALVGVPQEKIVDMNQRHGRQWRTTGEFGMVQLATP